MEDRRELYLGIVDSYCGPEALDPTVKAGTEELNFYSETNTYNRDNEPCIEFSVLEDFILGIDRMISMINGMKKVQNA